MYQGEEVDLFETGRRFAKLESILELEYSEYISKLLKYGKNVLDDYLQGIGRKKEIDILESPDTL